MKKNSEIWNRHVKKRYSKSRIDNIPSICSMMAGTIFFCMELHFVKSDARLLLRNFLKYNAKRQFWVKYTKLSFLHIYTTPFKHHKSCGKMA